MGRWDGAGLAERLWSKTAPRANGCIVWIGARQGSGYGKLEVGPANATVSYRAHRLAWQLRYGPIPEGMVVCHRCDHPPCVNLAHLFLATQAENNRDRDRKGRQRTSLGVDRPAAKLDPEKVRAIRASQETTAALARRFGVSEPVVWKVRAGKAWTHVS